MQRRLAPVIRLGPTPPIGAALLALLLAGGAVAVVARTVSRREIR